MTMVCREELNIFGGGGSNIFGREEANIMCSCVHEMSRAHVSYSYAAHTHVYTLLKHKQGLSDL